jgi:DnaK suppressor protein
MENAMNDKQKEELKNKIETEIVNLARQVKELEETVAPVKPDAAIGRLSRLDTMLNQGINKSSIAQSRQRILNLEDALNRLENDSFFGECEECGEDIPLARLLALPESRYCVHCAEHLGK